MGSNGEGARRLLKLDNAYPLKPTAAYGETATSLRRAASRHFKAVIMNIPEVNGEEWYIMRDEFLRYIADEVNPARIKHLLKPIREYEAKECYRILYEFWQKFDSMNLEANK